MPKPYIRVVPIGPKTYLQVDQVVAGIKDAVDKTLDGIKKDLEKTVETWDDRPRFDIDGPRLLGDRVEGSVGTGDKRYKWVNDGVSPHRIDASPGVMIFRPGYRAKTVRRQLASRVGGRTDSGPWLSPRVVSHPGIEAREFTDVAAERWQRKLIQEFNRAFPISAPASGPEIGLWAKFKQFIKGVVRF